MKKPTTISKESVSEYREFVQLRLRKRVLEAIEVVLEEEVDQALGCRSYERAEDRRGYRNGAETRRVTTSVGTRELRVPRARVRDEETGETTEFRSELLPRYARRTREVDEAILGTYLSGANSRRIRKALKPLLGEEHLSKSAVSRVVSRLKECFEEWQNRDLSEEVYAIVYLDGFHMRVKPILLRNYRLNDVARLSVDESETEVSGALGQAAHGTGAILSVVGGGPGVLIDEPILESAVDENGELSSGGGDGFGFTDAIGETSIVGAESGLCTPEAECGHAENASGAVCRGLCFRAEESPAGDFVIGREGKPGSEVLFSRPSVHIGTDLGEQAKRGIGSDGVDLGEVDPGDLVEERPELEPRFVHSGLARFSRRWQGTGETTEFRSELLPRYARRRTREVDEAILGTYLSGANSRRIRKALKPLLGEEHLSKSAVSRVVSRLKEDRFRIALRWNCDEMLGRAAIDASKNGRTVISARRSMRSFTWTAST